MDIQNESLCEIVSRFNPDVFVNLAAQAGVRYSLENPYAYLDANLHLGYRITERLNIFVKGSNLLNDNYEKYH